MHQLQNEMNRLFDRFGSSNGTRDGAVSHPALNVWGDKDQLYVEAELPGMELDDLEIYVNGDRQLSIKGKREAPSVEKGTWHRNERNYGEFSRTLELPHEVDPNKVQAEFKHGVLCVTLPRREETRPRRIEVKPR
jgi:HSP20 family protein